MGDVQLIDALRGQARTGEEVSVRARIQHRGTGAPWPKGKEGYGVRMGTTYEPLPLGTKPRGEGRSNLHLSLFPGEAQELSVPVRGPTIPGDYQVCVGVLQEAVTWMDVDCVKCMSIPAACPKVTPDVSTSGGWVGGAIAPMAGTMVGSAINRPSARSARSGTGRG